MSTLRLRGLLAAAVLCAAPAAGQSVEGRVTESQAGQPVAGARVILIDSANAIVARAETDTAGAFALRAPAAGEYRLRAERVGLRPTLTRAVPLAEGETVAVEVRMGAEPVVLDTAVAGVQRRTGISGRVLDDATGLPVAGARVSLLTTRGERVSRGLTDSLGHFHIRVPRAAGFHLRADRVGFRQATSAVLTVMPDDTVRVELRMSARSVLLAPLTVVAASRQVVRDHHLAGFEWRRDKQAWGRFLGPDEIKPLNPFHASDILQHVPFVRVETVHGSEGSVFDRVVTLPVRMATTTSGSRCVPNLYVDGWPVAMSTGLTLDQLVRGSSVAAVEVYESPVTAPGEFPARFNPFCGVIVIWTQVI